VRASNDPAIRLYEKLGYARVGLRKGYYEKPREDAVIMQRDLPADH
jgi:ribosomal-protein-alanine N-acetyltransferase